MQHVIANLPRDRSYTPGCGPAEPVVRRMGLRMPAISSVRVLVAGASGRRAGSWPSHRGSALDGRLSKFPWLQMERDGMTGFANWGQYHFK